MRFLQLLAAVGAICIPMLGATSAHAQATRTWVSGVGDDANPCSRTAPCKTFAGAVSKTAAGGIINCLDPGGFGAVTITKSITLDCTSTLGSILVAATNGINIPTAGITVILRGLDIEGIGKSVSPGLVGINVTAGAIVKVENCRIMQFTGGAAQGIRFAPAAGAASKLFVSDTEIFGNGAGIFISPTTNGSLVSLKRVNIWGNTFDGFKASGASGAVFASIVDSHSSLNGGNGFIASSSGSPALLDIQRSSADLNSGAGINADGSQGKIFIGTSEVSDNTTGFSQTNGGVIRSYGNNTVDSNTNTGAPTAPTLGQL
jgi:hypothetical protein